VVWWLFLQLLDHLLSQWFHIDLDTFPAGASVFLSVASPKINRFLPFKTKATQTPHRPLSSSSGFNFDCPKTPIEIVANGR
jgi:hypothetical protein